jgi:hypothetical protein
MRYLTLIASVAVSTLLCATASAQDLQIESIDVVRTSDVTLEAVRRPNLIYSVDGRLDSIRLVDIWIIRRTETSHVFGGFVGLLGGGLAGTGLGVLYLALESGEGDGDWSPLYGAAGIFVVSTLVGTIWGTSSGIPVSHDVGLSLDGLDETQRAAALERFILDERLR